MTLYLAPPQLEYAEAITRELNSLTALLGPPPTRANTGGSSGSSTAAAEAALGSDELTDYGEMEEAIQGPVSIMRDVFLKQAAGLAPDAELSAVGAS